jgi:hypothetical protein
MHVREPLVSPVDISELRPTQITVGMHEVRAKRESWQARKDKSEFLGRHMIPVILGPKERHYIIDQHHLARALHDEGQERVLVSIVTDLRMLDRDAFWIFLDNRGWCHPYDQKGMRCRFADIPKSVADLVDDPFRSLAGELRKAGGFSKDTTPFSEFLWADFLRRRIKRASVKRDFDKALGEAMTLAKSPDAHFLPGWCGPIV